MTPASASSSQAAACIIPELCVGTHSVSYLPNGRGEIVPAVPERVVAEFHEGGMCAPVFQRAESGGSGIGGLELCSQRV